MARGSGLQGQFQLHMEFKPSLGYVGLCLKISKKIKESKEPGMQLTSSKPGLQEFPGLTFKTEKQILQ